MKNNSGFLKSTLALLMLGILLFSCKKEPSQIGLDIVGGNPLIVHFSDTTNVQVYSTLRDSVRTDGMTNHLLGVVVDPVFGTTRASLAIQYNLSLSSYSFGENATVDSVVLSVPYQETAVYGDSTAQLSFKVYELGELLNIDSAYYSSKVASFLPGMLADATFVPRPYDSVLIDTNLVTPHFRIHLPNELGQSLISYDDSVYANNDDFVEHFNGLYFDPVSMGGTGNIAFLNMYGAYSKLTVYYKNSTSESLSYSFVPSIYSPSFQNFDHLDYVGSDPDFYSQVIQKDTLKGEQKFYLQSLGGVDSYIRFPSLFNRADLSKYAINEAKLIITNVDPDNIFVQPARLVMFQKIYSGSDSTSSFYYLDDANAGDAYYGGYYNSTSKQYEFRITHFLQNYIAGKYDSDNLLLQILGASYKGSRLIAGGSNPSVNPESRIRLEIIYTEANSENK